MANKKKAVRKGICLPLVLITVILTCIGLVMVLSSSYNSILLRSNNASYLSSFKTQAIVAVAGFAIMMFLSRLDYHFFRTKGVLISGFVMCIGLLCLVFLFDPVYDSHRWIQVGSSFTIQPSEIAKFFGIFYAAFYTSERKWWYRSVREFMGLIVPIGILAGLILIEPDLSTTLTFLFSVVAIMFVSGMPWQWLVGAFGAAAGLIVLMISVTGYQGRRFQAWLHAWDDPKNVGYQIVQSLYAIGDGGLFGVGLGNSKQKITHLPMSDTDYIFSIICEEFGFVGATLVVALYVAFAFFGIKIAMEASDRYGAYLAIGITTLIVLQAFFNMAVATNVMPSTGLTLPFISKGASSLGVMLCGTGVLLSVSAYKKVPQQAKS